MDIIYQEKVSGANMNREQLQKMLSQLSEGDIIYVTDLTRITRSTQDLFSLIGQIKSKNADLIRMRQREGIEIAKKEGKFKRRVKKYHKDHEGMNYAIKLYREGNMTVKKICKVTNISRSSLYRRIAEEKESNE